MKERAKRVPVSRELRQQVKHEQGCKCGYCHQQYDEHSLYVHHIKPVSKHEKGEGEKANCRHNLVAVCESCHKELDYLALNKDIYLTDLVEMIPGIDYILN